MEDKNKPLLSMGGAKKKNGHKYDCKCHICQNILAKAKRGEYGKPKEVSKKINGHKMDCKCCICKNMLAQKNKKTAKMCKNMKRKTRRGGIITDEIITIEDEEPIKKCNCPICKKNNKNYFLAKKRKTRKQKK